MTTRGFLRSVLALFLLVALAACGLQTPSSAPPTVEQQGAQEVFPLSPLPTAETGEITDETTDLWFVEFASAPRVKGGSAAMHRNERAAFRSAAAAQRIQYQERFDFETLFNGLSVRATPAAMGKLAQLPGVTAVYPVVTVSIPETQPALEPEMFTAIAMTGADYAQNELGLSGTGIRVAVMDTGIDYNHPDLGGPCFGPGCRVVTGFDFVGDAFDANPNNPTYNPVPEPNDDPMDCNGHGTHVAGIVGASGTVTGVAPGVEFGAYKVFGCVGSTTADIMIAAMEMALADGMHVLNMSIGAAFQWPQYPTAVAASNLVDAGMVVVASIGNSGASGVYSAGAPGVGEKVIGVASFDNTHVSISAFTISPDDTLIGYGPAAAAPPPPTSGSLSMARTGTTTTPDDACTPIAQDLTDHAVLIRRGTCPFHTKALNAQNAGAAAVVLYNNVPGRFSPTVAGTPVITIPVVAISDTEGALIDGRLQDGPVTMTWTDETLTTTNPTGGLISSFSSYGLSPDLTLKPDIGAPGGLIYAPYPLALGGYATISGTSMSSPHVAGGVALLLEAHPNTPAEAVRGILQNSADPKVWWGNPPAGFLDNVHRQGAGMLDIPGAVLSTTSVTPAKLSLGESAGGQLSATLHIRNNSSSAVTYTLSHAPALATGPSVADPTGTFVPGFYDAPASVSFSRSEVRVPAGASTSVRVRVTPNPDLPDLSQYGGYIVITGDDGEVNRVPYAGFKGDYQSIVALSSNFGLPWLTHPSALVPVGPEPTFSMAPGDQPRIAYQLLHQAQALRVEVFDAETGRAYGRAFDLEYVGRNAATNQVFTLTWDGLTKPGNSNNWRPVPNGDYVFKLTVVKALGNGNNPAHTETWTSPVFTVARP